MYISLINIYYELEILPLPGLSKALRTLSFHLSLKYVCMLSYWVVSLSVCDPVDSSPPGSSVHGIILARILEWVAISFSRRSSWPRDWTQTSCAAGRFFTIWATKQAQLPTSRWEVSLEKSDLPTTKCPDLSGLCVDGSAHLVTKQPPIHGALAPVLITISKTGFFL